MIEPRLDYVLVQRLEDTPQSGTILIPDVAKETSIRGKVLAVGPGKRDEDGDLIPMESKVGDIVLFNSRWSDLASTHYAADTAVHFDKGIQLVQEADIFCIEHGRDAHKRKGSDRAGAGRSKNCGNVRPNQGRASVKARTATGKG